jgi:predicted nucleic acid-binding protein
MTVASCLVDTNILLRLASRSGGEHPLIDRALAHLAEQGTNFYYTLQNMAEFWNVMTRPKARNGFGFSLIESERAIRAIESGMTLLSDNAAVYARWRTSSFNMVFRECRCTMRAWPHPCMLMG